MLRVLYVFIGAIVTRICDTADFIWTDQWLIYYTWTILPPKTYTCQYLIISVLFFRSFLSLTIVTVDYNVKGSFKTFVQPFARTNKVHAHSKAVGALAAGETMAALSKALLIFSCNIEKLSGACMGSRLDAHVY